jgi:hypothetical protein
MKNVFFIFGYGVPKNILQDENYNSYLKTVFNKIYDFTIQKNITDPIIICSGGPTDLFRPYKRTEAEEMIRFFQNLIKRPYLKPIAKNWSFIPEKNSLSTLENLLNCQAILTKNKITRGNLHIFCEQTRRRRVKILTQKLLTKNFHLKITPIDFNTSPDRYFDPKFLAKKEKLVLRYDLWALKNYANFQKYHQTFTDKFGSLRRAKPATRPEVMKVWWQRVINELEN